MRLLWAIIGELADGELPAEDARLVRPPWWVLVLLLALVLGFVVGGRAQELPTQGAAPCAVSPATVGPARVKRTKLAKGCIRNVHCVGDWWLMSDGGRWCDGRLVAEDKCIVSVSELRKKR